MFVAARSVSRVCCRSQVSNLRLGGLRCTASPFFSTISSNAENEMDYVYDEEGNTGREVIDQEGEWAGCTKRFLKPLRISTRGPGTSYLS